MALDATQLTQLDTELTTDPVGLGYAGKTHAEQADLINSLETGRTVPNNIEIKATELYELFDPTEYDNVLDPVATPDANTREKNSRLIGHMLVMPDINLGGANLAAQIATVFGVGSTTYGAFNPKRTRIASRTEELFGEGIKITPSDVANAGRTK